jgi:hypothetical protein
MQLDRHEKTIVQLDRHEKTIVQLGYNYSMKI